MTCFPSVPYYIPWSKIGLQNAWCPSDGYSVQLTYNLSYAVRGYILGGYNIYYSTERENVFTEGPKYTNVHTPYNDVWLGDFVPGDTLFFATRAFQYDSTWYDPSFLPNAPSARPNQSSVLDGYLKYYPETFLANDINDSQLVIGLSDIELFPAYGVIQIGYELIRYNSIDLFDGNIMVSERGFLGTMQTEHTVAGWDGYGNRSPIVVFWKGLEEQNGLIFQEEVKFGYPNNAYTLADGYRVGDNLLTLDPNAVEPERTDNPKGEYCYSGWHRTDPRLLLGSGNVGPNNPSFGGGCLDSYINRLECCIDEETGEMASVNFSFTELVDQNLALLIEQTGEPVILMRRMYSGIRCSCYEPNVEVPDLRCTRCIGVGYVRGYTQYFNPKRSDGKIFVRFGPADEDLKLEDAGIESTISYASWTLVTPMLQDRDVIIRYDDLGVEEFRYVVTSVTRNRLMYGQSGRQSFVLSRVRKTDPIYQIKSFNDHSIFPIEVNTNIALLRGANNVSVPHSHRIVIGENTVLASFSEETQESLGHTHTISANSILAGQGWTEESLGHSHAFTL